MARGVRLPLSKRQRFEVFKRDSFTCRYCGRSTPDVTLQVDHVTAVANGGSDNQENLVTACVECNAGKSDIPLQRGTANRRSDSARIFYIRGIVRNRFPAVDPERALGLIRQAWLIGFDLDRLQTLALVAATWASVAGRIHAELLEYEDRKRQK